jgi:hypothetical protein
MDPEIVFTLVMAAADLAAQQGRLPPEFEAALFDNLWELYAR